MKEHKFTLHDDFLEGLTNSKFNDAKASYIKKIIENKPHFNNTNSIFELIDQVKRNPTNIGPYEDISVFEALNRIGSDLVLLRGAEKLFNEGLDKKIPTEILLRMGNTKGFDFEVYFGKTIIYGEAFNAAESFCKDKMRQAIHKLIEKNPDPNATEGIVFVNDDVKDVLRNYKNEMQLKNNFNIHLIFCETNLLIP